MLLVTPLVPPPPFGIEEEANGVGVRPAGRHAGGDGPILAILAVVPGFILGLGGFTLPVEDEGGGAAVLPT
jgi:hypothetical protein